MWQQRHTPASGEFHSISAASLNEPNTRMEIIQLRSSKEAQGSHGNITKGLPFEISSGSSILKSNASNFNIKLQVLNFKRSKVLGSHILKMCVLYWKYPSLLHRIRCQRVHDGSADNLFFILCYDRFCSRCITQQGKRLLAAWIQTAKYGRTLNNTDTSTNANTNYRNQIHYAVDLNNGNTSLLTIDMAATARLAVGSLRSSRWQPRPSRSPRRKSDSQRDCENWGQRYEEMEMNSTWK